MGKLLLLTRSQAEFPSKLPSKRPISDACVDDQAEGAIDAAVKIQRSVSMKSVSEGSDSSIKTQVDGKLRMLNVEIVSGRRSGISFR